MRVLRHSAYLRVHLSLSVESVHHRSRARFRASDGGSMRVVVSSLESNTCDATLIHLDPNIIEVGVEYERASFAPHPRRSQRKAAILP